MKDKATEVNLYESGQIDCIGLTGEFVDKYKASKEFKQREDVTVQFLRFNQKNEVLKNRHVRLAISEAMNKKEFVETLLNNGSRPAYGLIPEKFAMSPDGKDFRKENGNLVKDDVKTAPVFVAIYHRSFLSYNCEGERVRTPLNLWLLYHVGYR